MFVIAIFQLTFFRTTLTRDWRRRREAEIISDATKCILCSTYTIFIACAS